MADHDQSKCGNRSMTPCAGVDDVFECELPTGHEGWHAHGVYRQQLADADVAVAMKFLCANEETRLRGAVASSVICRECSSPATHGMFCVYCANRTGNHSDLCLDEAHINEAMITHHEPRNAEARARNLAALEAEKQKPTQHAADHPWLCDEDDP